MIAPKKPCAECPWRKDVVPGQFKPGRFVALASTSYDMSSTIFACHKSIAGRDTACAGFILRGAAHNLALRLAYCRGDIKPDQVSDGGYPLFDNYRDMAVANGVPIIDPVLRLCRER